MRLRNRRQKRRRKGPSRNFRLSTGSSNWKSKIYLRNTTRGYSFYSGANSNTAIASNNNNSTLLSWLSALLELMMPKLNSSNCSLNAISEPNKNRN